MLFDPASHEPLTDRAWDAGRARAAIRAIAADAEGAFDPDALWRAHPRDLDEGPLPAVTSLYFGASGIVWALDDLQRRDMAALQRDWAALAAGLPERYRARPDLPEETDGQPVPSLLMGEAGILLVAHRLAPAAGQEERLLACVEANAANPAWELMWGSPGTMLAASAMHERTGDERWARAWRASADALWDAWGDDVWEQHLYGRVMHCLGPVHGWAGNVHALWRGRDLLDAARRAELERRAVAGALAHAQREDGLAQWPPALEPPSDPASRARTQWCHGAPGIVAALAPVAVADERLTDVLVAGGELTWRAGPLRKGPSLCHGTAGNGYAFLKLLERTGDERWLDRARAFAMHTIDQVEHARATFGTGHHSLWTGDLGAACYVASCISASADMPTLDAA